MTLAEPVVRSVAAYLDGWLAFRQRYLLVPGVQAAVLLGDEVLLSGAYGRADVERDVALRTDHLFRVASHSKTFTATAVLQLAGAGRVRLDDPVGQWLPFVAGSAAGVTLRDLLSHAGGLVRDGVEADFWQLAGPFPSAPALRALVAGDVSVHPSNERFKYSNIGYGLLGLVIEAASGSSYADYLTAQVVRPLGLGNTGPEYDPARAADFAVGYSALSYAAERVPIEPVDTGALAPATGFYSTAEDLCRYAAAHFWGDDRLLPDASKRLMQRPWWPVEGLPDDSYGLGFGVTRCGPRSLVGHGGGFPGHVTRTLFDPTDRLAVAVLTNAIDGPAGDLATTAVKLIDLAVDTVPDPRAPRFVVRLANLWGVVDVTLLGGQLFLIDPTGADPTSSATRLSVDGDATLRVTSGPGYGAVGETMEYTFTEDGAVSSVRGAGGLTWWPLAGFALPAGGVPAPS